MIFPRSTGILLHPISLPSHGGIGDFGPAAYEFLDFLAEARQGVWQVLPLNPPANGNSPYSSTSAFAGNPQLVSLERLAERGWLDPASLSVLPTEVGRNNSPPVSRCAAPCNFSSGSSGALSGTTARRNPSVLWATLRFSLITKAPT